MLSSLGMLVAVVATLIDGGFNWTWILAGMTIWFGLFSGDPVDVAEAASRQVFEGLGSVQASAEATPGHALSALHPPTAQGGHP